MTEPQRDEWAAYRDRLGGWTTPDVDEAFRCLQHELYGAAIVNLGKAFEGLLLELAPGLDPNLSLGKMLNAIRGDWLAPGWKKRLDVIAKIRNQHSHVEAVRSRREEHRHDAGKVLVTLTDFLRDHPPLGSRGAPHPFLLDAALQAQQLVADINQRQPFGWSVPPRLRQNLEWAEGFAEDLRGQQPSTLLVIGPDLDRGDDIRGNIFDRLRDLPPDEWGHAAFHYGTETPQESVAIKFDLPAVLRKLVERLNVVELLNYSHIARQAFPKWIDFRPEYEAARKAGQPAFVDCVVTESNLHHPERSRGYRPFTEWQAQLLQCTTAERIIVFGFDIPQFTRLVASWLPRNRSFAPIMFLTRATRSAYDTTTDDPFGSSLRLRLFETFEDHVDGILALAQIDWALQNAPESAVADWSNDLSERLLARYEDAMNRSCGGGSYDVVQQQIPVVAAGQAPFDTILGAMSSQRSMERALLIAPAGAGKTTQALFVAAEVCRIALGHTTVSDKHRLLAGDRRWPLVKKLPVFITAQEIGSIIDDHRAAVPLQRDGLQPDWYYLHIGKVLGLSAEHTRDLRDLLAQGCVLFLIDSIDELDASVHTSALAFVRTLLEQYPQCPALITSRVGEVVRRAWPSFVPLTLEPLTHELIKLYVTGRKRHAPGCRPLDDFLELLRRDDRDHMAVLRQPIALRLFCDALEAMPPEMSFRELPSDRAGIYLTIMEMVVDGNIRAAGIPEDSPLGQADLHLRALANLARDLLRLSNMATESPTQYEKVAGTVRSVMRQTLQQKLRHAVDSRGGVSDDDLQHIVTTYLPRTAFPAPQKGIVLFEYVYGERVRFAHRSFQEFLTALAHYFELADAPPAGVERVPERMEELDKLGDDREVSRFFAGLILRGDADWQRRYGQSIVQHRLKTGEPQDSTWVLRLLGDVGSGDRGSSTTVQHFFGHKLQREMRDIIENIRSARKSEIPELLAVFFRARPRNAFLLYHAVKELRALRKVEGERVAEFMRRADSILGELWSESALRFGPSVRAAELRAFMEKWTPDDPVPAPYMIRIPAGEVVLSNGETKAVPAYYAAETLVTQAQFAVMTGRRVEKREELHRPCTHATWFDAMMFARWAFGGKGTLPTRTQWLRMTRGEKRHPFPWGAETDAEAVNRLANTAFFKDLTGSTPVDHFPPQGEYGLRDLGGNLLEWTDTWFDPDETVDGAAFETEPEHGYARLLMGGSYAHIVEKAACTLPFPSSPENYVDVIGMRIVVPEEEYIRWKNNASRS